jgi:hypothetical protein
LVTSFDPMSPLPPITTIFIMSPFCAASPVSGGCAVVAAESVLVVDDRAHIRHVWSVLGATAVAMIALNVTVAGMDLMMWVVEFSEGETRNCSW